MGRSFTGDEADLRRLVPSANGDPLGHARELLARRIAEHLARIPFQLHAAPAEGHGFALRYRPPSLRAALWQRFAAELAGLLHCARCPAPGCGRWFLKGTHVRNDKVFCSNACKNRAFRTNGKLLSLQSHAQHQRTVFARGVVTVL